MTFWSAQYDVNSKDPKEGLGLRLLLKGLNGAGDIVWFAKKVAKPSYTITEAKHSYLNHNFTFRVELSGIQSQ